MHKLLHRTHLCLRFLVNGELLLSSQRYGFKFIINSEAMSTHKRSAGASTENCTVKKSCSSHIDTNKHNLTPTEITQNRIDMQIMEKNELEILEAPDQSENDKKQYRVIRLGNGLKALLIYDPVAETKSIVDFSKCNVKVPTNGNEMVSTMALDDGDDESESESSDNEEDGDGGEAREKLAACSLSVDVGSFSDPRDVQGLAHFLEHMIFMGSEKYPSENEFDQFIKKAGGFGNADTDFDETSFYFEVREQCLDAALDRFSQFFKAPLMLKEAMTREREAVESEFSSKMNGEGVRRDQLLASLGNANHPSSIFSWGNLKTLKENIDDDALYQRVHDFRRRHYSAHRMFLAIQARLPLDELQELVVKHYSNVPNNQLAGLDFALSTHENAFQPKFHEKVFFVKPVGNVSKIDLTWCLPPQNPTYKTKPYHYLSFLLGYEGEGSVLSYLRKKLWAVELVAGIDASGFGSNSMFCLFTISIHLTDDGFPHIDEILEAIFSYLRLLQKAGPSEQLFREIASIEENTFRFASERDAIDNVEDLVINLKHYPSKYLLTGDSLYFEYDPAAIQRAIDVLNTRKFNIMITSTHKYDENVEYELKEEWFGTEYTERNMPEKWISLWNNVQPFKEFTLPAPNPFIADDFSIFYDKNHPIPKYPTKILENDVCELWFRQDDKFKLPYAHCYFYFTTPLVLSSVDNMIMMILHSTLLKYQLVERLYPATVAGLEYQCYAADKGLVLKVSGYNQKLHVIIDAFTKCLKSLADDVTEEQFRVFVQQLFKMYENIFRKPKSIAKELRLSVVQQHHVALNVKNQRLKAIDFNDFQTFCRDYCQQVKIKTIMQGNLLEERAQSMMQIVLTNLDCGKIKDPTSVQLHAVKIPCGASYLRVQSFNPNDTNSVITNFYQIGPISFRTNVLIDLLMMIAEEPLFDILRNKEQLGYDVSCNLRDNYGILGYSIDIHSQENKFSVDHVNERIENYRNELLSIIEKMPHAEFEEYKATLAKIKLTEDSKLNEEVVRNWGEITTGDYSFDRHHKEVETLVTISHAEFLQFYRDNYGANERKFSTQVIGSSGSTGANGSASDKNDIDSNDVEDTNKHENLSFDDIVYVDFKKPTSGILIKDIAEFKKTLDVYPLAISQ